jgi:hypothetical protein
MDLQVKTMSNGGKGINLFECEVRHDIVGIIQMFGSLGWSCIQNEKNASVRGANFYPSISYNSEGTEVHMYLPRTQSLPVWGFPLLSLSQSRSTGQYPKIGPDIPVPKGPCRATLGLTGVPGCLPLPW